MKSINLLDSRHFQIFLKLLFCLLLVANLVMTAWYVLHNDILFSADIARDFHLLDEIERKKFILIGPRSSVSGLFHGPLWLYINFPAYLIGNGNPVIVGWFWIILIAIFLIGSFHLAKRLFNSLVAYLYVLMLSTYTVFHARGLFNPHGVFFTLPFFFYCFVKFVETKKRKYMGLTLALSAIMIQFQLSIGFPYFFLSSLYFIYSIYKTRQFKNLFFFLIPIVFLSNFVIFDLRHEFLLSKAVYNFAVTSHIAGENTIPYSAILIDRLKIMTTGIEITREHQNMRNISLFTLFLLLFLQIKENKQREVYLSFLYFYFGYFLLSFINKGFILYFYIYPQFSLIFLIFSSLATSRWRKPFVAFFFIVFVLNFQTAIQNTQAAEGFIGKNEDSWKFLAQMSNSIFQNEENEFGYFIFSPDLLGYQPKYAMFYVNKLYNQQALNFIKKPITYLISAPHPYYKSEWWKENELNLYKNPVKRQIYKNGYLVEKYLLTNDEIKVPYNPAIDSGINFR